MFLTPARRISPVLDRLQYRGIRKESQKGRWSDLKAHRDFSEVCAKEIFWEEGRADIDKGEWYDGSPTVLCGCPVLFLTRLSPAQVDLACHDKRCRVFPANFQVRPAALEPRVTDLCASYLRGRSTGARIGQEGDKAQEGIDAQDLERFRRMCN